MGIQRPTLPCCFIAAATVLTFAIARPAEGAPHPTIQVAPEASAPLDPTLPPGIARIEAAAGRADAQRTVPVGANQLAAPSVEPVPGETHIAFAMDERYPLSTPGWGIKAGDIDGDGITDLLVATDDGVAVLLGRNPGFAQPIEYPAGPGDVSLAIADVDRDGRLRADRLRDRSHAESRPLGWCRHGRWCPSSPSGRASTTSPRLMQTPTAISTWRSAMPIATSCTS